MTKLFKAATAGVAAVAILAGPAMAAVSVEQNQPTTVAAAANESTINLTVSGMR